MGTIGLIFDTEGGNTNRVAVLIERCFPQGTIDVWSAAQLNRELLRRYNALILGTPSMKGGHLADNWQFFVESDGLDLSGKTVALFGLGDQANYPDEFADGLGVLHDRVVALGATVIGQWPSEGYTFNQSRAWVDGHFVGLVLDTDNQPQLTTGRVARWVETIVETLRGA